MLVRGKERAELTHRRVLLPHARPYDREQAGWRRRNSCVSRSPHTLPLTARPEYRSAIFFHTPEQEQIAKRVTEEVQKKHFDPKGAHIAIPSTLYRY